MDLISLVRRRYDAMAAAPKKTQHSILRPVCPVVFWCGGGGLVIATRKKKTRRKINFLALFNINTQQTTDVDDDDDHDEGDDAGWLVGC